MTKTPFVFRFLESRCSRAGRGSISATQAHFLNVHTITMEFLGEYREVVEFLFGGVGVTLVGALGFITRKLKAKVKDITARLEEEKAVSPGAALAMVYYDNFVRPLLHTLANSSVVRINGEAVAGSQMRFVLWMPVDMPLDPGSQRQYQQDLVSSRNDIEQVTIEIQSAGRPRFLYGKRTGQELKLFDQPVAVTTLSYFSRVLDAAGLPKEMSEKRKRALHQRERDTFAATITRLATADHLNDYLTISTDPIAFL